MSEHLSADLLLRYLDRELDAHESALAQQHLAECSGCRAQLDALRSLSAAIDRHGADLLVPAGPRRRELVAALDRQEAMHPRKALAALAMAASVVLAVGLSLRHADPPAPPAAPPQPASDNFIALPTADASDAGAVVMEIEVPRAAVALAGIAPGDGAPDARVRAEVLVGADGVARAIRLLN
jgi:hypothetical protein